jgi:hypothetical protein
MGHSGIWRVFLSSTWTDMQEERTAIEHAISRMRDLEFAGMELFGSRPEAPKETILNEVRNSDVYVGVFGSRYGSVDSASGLSMTELEYREANGHLPCLIYVRSEDQIPAISGEADAQSQAKLAALKADLKRNHVVTWFNTPNELAMNVVLDLHNLLTRLPESDTPPKQGAVNIEDLIDILSRRCSKHDIQVFALSLSLDFDNLPGEGKKVIGLLEEVRHREMMPDLLAVIRRRRPDIKI